MVKHVEVVVPPPLQSDVRQVVNSRNLIGDGTDNQVWDDPTGYDDQPHSFQDLVAKTFLDMTLGMLIVMNPRLHTQGLLNEIQVTMEHL